MEFVTGYQEALVDFCELMFCWYKKYLNDSKQLKGCSTNSPCERTATISKLPMDSSLWILHVLENSKIGISVENPERQIPEKFYNDEALEIRDLEKFISIIQLEEEEGEIPTSAHNGFLKIDCLLLVTDENGAVMGFDFLFNSSCGCGCCKQMETALRAYSLLCQCMVFPMSSGEPHRPKRVTAGDPFTHGFLTHMLPKVGVKLTKTPLRAWALKQKFTFPSMRVKACHVCKRRSFEVKLSLCEHCRAVLYCSETCRRADWTKRPEDVSHQYWCGMMQGYMKQAKALADFPFEYTSEVTSDTFDKELFLSARDLSHGYWLKESKLVQPSNYNLEFYEPFRNNSHAVFLQGRWNPYHPLTEEGKALLQTFPLEALNIKTPFVRWRDYYKWRRFDLDSPVAALLTYPLTIYYVITSLVPEHFPELNILNKQSLKIHVIEATKAFDMLMVFWELSILLPHVALEFHFVGARLPKEMDEQHFILQRKDGCTMVVKPHFTVEEKSEKRTIRIKSYAKPYHMLQGPKPDLVIGFNSGFGLSDTWLSSLPRLQSFRVPAYFTECSEYSCAIDKQVMNMAAGGTISRPCVNPFRSPFRIIGIDNDMPWYSNAFVFHLIYKGTTNLRQQQPQQSSQQQPTIDGTADDAPETGRRKRDKKQNRNSGRRRK